MKSPKWLPANLTFGLPSSSSFGKPATRLLLPTSPVPYLQLGGVGRDVPWNLEHLAFLADEDPAQTATGVVLASQAARQEQQQAGEGCRHLCRHICARRLYLKGKNAETSQANSLKIRPKSWDKPCGSQGMISQKVSLHDPRFLVALEWG